MAGLTGERLTVIISWEVSDISAGFAGCLGWGKDDCTHSHNHQRQQQGGCHNSISVHVCVVVL